MPIGTSARTDVPSPRRALDVQPAAERGDAVLEAEQAGAAARCRRRRRRRRSTATSRRSPSARTSTLACDALAYLATLVSDSAIT